MKSFDVLPQKAVFIDKDGTLVTDVPYNVDPDRVSFETGVFEGLRTLYEHGFKLVIVSNQPGLEMGAFSQDDLDLLIRYFEKKFMENGVMLSGFYYCPHLPAKAGAGCGCRKPEPELFFRAATQLQIDLSVSWMIGDILHDVEAGNRAGCRSVLINNGNETEWNTGGNRDPEYTAGSFLEAADYINTQTISENEHY